jgi:hypothetical protein
MEHDASYKLLFSHARMVEDLLRGFVHEAWVHDVDWTTLERVSDSQISKQPLPLKWRGFATTMRRPVGQGVARLNEGRLQTP